MTEEPTPNIDVAARYRVAPPIVQAAIVAMLDFEESVDPMGYDLDYFQEDLPWVVAAAIKPWATGAIIPLTSCPVCYGYRLKIHRVTGDLLAVVRAEYASHQASHNDSPEALNDESGAA